MRRLALTVVLILLVAASCSSSGAAADPEPVRRHLLEDLTEVRDATGRFLALYQEIQNIEPPPGVTVGEVIDLMNSMRLEVDGAYAQIEAAADAFMARTESYLSQGGGFSDLGLNESEVTQWRARLDVWLENMREQGDPANFCFGNNLPSGALDWTLDRLLSYRPFAECLLDFAESDLVREATEAAADVTRLSNTIARRLGA